MGGLVEGVEANAYVHRHTHKWLYSGNFDRPLGQDAKAGARLKKSWMLTGEDFNYFDTYEMKRNEFTEDVCSWEKSRAVSVLKVSDKCQKQLWKEQRLFLDLLNEKMWCFLYQLWHLVARWAKKTHGEREDFHDLGWSISKSNFCPHIRKINITITHLLELLLNKQFFFGFFEISSYRNTSRESGSALHQLSWMKNMDVHQYLCRAGNSQCNDTSQRRMWTDGALKLRFWLEAAMKMTMLKGKT